MNNSSRRYPLQWDTRALTHDGPDGADVTADGGPVEARLAAVVAHRHGGAGGDEHLADLGVAGLGGQVQRRVAPLVAVVEVGAALLRLEQAVHDVRVAVPHRGEQIERRHDRCVTR